MPRSAPQRSCLGCRETRDKGDLLRFVLSPDGTLVPDVLAKLPGRGAYTCFSSICVTKAVERKQFSRAFRCDVVVPPAEELTSQIAARLTERVASYLALANKAGKIISGSDMVMERLRKGGGVGLVLLASDISGDIGDKVAGLAKRGGVPCLRMLDKDRFGELLGKGLRSVLAVMVSGFVPSILNEVKRYGNFLDGGGVDEQDPRV
ncbi:DUF448 domain-containing protein [Geobacter pickeringii]|uniref:50S ribosomal protein L7 n=1 Tax=Geobacter pickeringii TaxID=345632 RepID=A0A0B5BFG7_9BACT|nr:DUF448 domain-containing protein [Geobacter pickeringii]AJE03275.1 50S ribosomal protein L7 [Geobacter pickeringii]